MEEERERKGTAPPPTQIRVVLALVRAEKWLNAFALNFRAERDFTNGVIQGLSHPHVL